MNSIKMRIIFIIIVTLYTTLIPAVLAKEQEESITDNLNGLVSQEQKEINGVEIKEMKIFRFEGEEMVQLRELARVYNWSLYYNSKKKEIILKNSNKTIVLSTNVEQDKKAKELSLLISEGRTYLSMSMLRNVLKELGEERVITGLYTDKKEYFINEKLSAFIRIYNFTEDSLRLNFGSGQRYDLYLTKDNQEIWCWSDGKFFTMALVSEELEAGEILEYDVDMDIELKAGDYVFSGELATIPERIKLDKIQLEIIEE